MSANIAKTFIAIGAMLLIAACSSDGSSFGGGGGGGGGAGPLDTTLGVTGEGGITETLGVSALTDPLLGTEGILGGGREGLVGGEMPDELREGITLLAEGLAPVVDAVDENLPLDMITDQLPGLGIAGDGGLLADLTGQDPVGMLLGSNGTVPALVGGGNDGALGDILPEGGLPGLPGGGDGGAPELPGLDGLPLVGDLLGGGLPGLPGGDGGAPELPGLDGLPIVGDLLGGGLPDLPGGDGGDSPLAPVTDLVGGLVGGLPVPVAQ